MQVLGVCSIRNLSKNIGDPYYELELGGTQIFKAVQYITKYHDIIIC